MKNVSTRRSGSVLILVVAMLVILALMGTAYLATAQLDRMATTGRGGSVVAGAISPERLDKALATAQAAADAEVTYDVQAHRLLNWFRPPQSWFNNPVRTTYEHWDAGDHSLIFPSGDNQLTAPPDANADQRVDAWLAARLPEKAGNVYYWPHVSGWPEQLDGTQPVRFESPYVAENTTEQKWHDDSLQGRFRQRATEFNPDGSPKTPIEITSVKIQYPLGFQFPDTMAERVRVHPAFVLNHPTSGRYVYLAADADGDGIADSMLTRLNSASFGSDTVVYPGLPSQPVTWYVAYRIVDNNSALNVNTARRVDGDQLLVTGEPALEVFKTNLGIFRANIGLYDLLDTQLGIPGLAASYREIDSLEMYRHGGPANSTPLNVSDRMVLDDLSIFAPGQFVTFGDALEHQLARRVTSAGFNANGANAAQYRAFGQTDATSLAYRFTMTDRYGLGSVLEQTLFNSLMRYASNIAPIDPAKSFPYYPANLYDLWYHQNFDFTNARAGAINPYNFGAVGQPSRPAYYASPTPPLRALLTTYNPTSNAVAMPDMTRLKQQYTGVVEPLTGSTDDTQMPDWTLSGNQDRHSKASVNTASFGELWRAYWAVMTEQRSSQNAADRQLHTPSNANDRMFRPSLREGTDKQGAWTNYEQLLLRAALAAVNTMDLRNPEVDGNNQPLRPTMRQIQIGSRMITVFGTRPQPYITEVYANNNNIVAQNGGTNPQGYIAVELCNPFPYQLNLQGWQVWAVDRNQSPMTVTRIHTFTASTIVPAATDTQNGFAVMHNIAGGANDAKYRPDKAALRTGATMIPVPGLSRVMGWDGTNARDPSPYELVLVRPASKNPFVSSTTTDGYAPVDSFDFRGFDPTPNPVDVTDQNGNTVQRFDCTGWHYIRVSDASAAGGKHWHFVYPGPYRDQWEPGQGPRPEDRRHEVDRATGGSDSSHFAVLEDRITVVENWATQIKLAEEDTRATYERTFPIQLANVDWAGGNKLSRSNTRQRFPFGGFARNGDILKVPYIGSYLVSPVGMAQGSPPQTVVEANAVTMDSYYAEHRLLKDQVNQQALPEIGRFCPEPFGPEYNGSNAPQYVPAYDWATDLFDYLTVQCPKDDFLPNYDPRFQMISGGQFKASSVSNAGGTANDKEDSVGVQGLVNINTAPVEVLSMLPLVMKSDGTVDRDRSYQFARAIVIHRRTVGPFTSIFDLNRVRLPGSSAPADQFRYPDAMYSMASSPGSTNAAVADPGYAFGDISPMVKDKTDKVSGDFEYKYAQITRLSNLVTTRSDTFTVYVLVQAWQNAGKEHPVLLAEKRSAYIVDRSKMSQTVRGAEKTGVSSR